MYFYTSTNESFVPPCKFITMPNLDVEREPGGDAKLTITGRITQFGYVLTLTGGFRQSITLGVSPFAYLVANRVADNAPCTKRE